MKYIDANKLDNMSRHLEIMNDLKLYWLIDFKIFGKRINKMINTLLAITNSSIYFLFREY